MRAAFVLALLIVASFTFSGCLFTHVEIPYDTDLDVTEFGDKQGEASWNSVLWLVAWGDAGTNAAAQNGGITTVRHMDKKILSVLFGLYHHEETIVYGD